MSCTRWHRHSIQCILPPYVVREVAKNGSPQQRERTLRAIDVDGTFRSMRLVTSGIPQVALARLPGPMVVENQRLRTIYDVKGSEALPGVVARNEGQGDTGDLAVDEAYTGLGATYDFFWEIFGRNSIDRGGMPLNAHVHYGQDYVNAFWDGQRMVFGDGDGDLFNRFTVSIDVIGHELAHGVTEYEGPLTYFRQAGALNESLSDVFGSLVKQRALGQTAD